TTIARMNAPAGKHLRRFIPGKHALENWAFRLSGYQEKNIRGLIDERQGEGHSMSTELFHKRRNHPLGNLADRCAARTERRGVTILPYSEEDGVKFRGPACSRLQNLPKRVFIPSGCRTGVR